MVKLVRLTDGSYKLSLKYNDDNITIEKVWYFNETQPTDAEEEKLIFCLEDKR